MLRRPHNLQMEQHSRKGKEKGRQHASVKYLSNLWQTYGSHKKFFKSQFYVWDRTNLQHTQANNQLPPFSKICNIK
jgi:hypothetical protein